MGRNSRGRNIALVVIAFALGVLFITNFNQYYKTYRLVNTLDEDQDSTPRAQPTQDKSKGDEIKVPEKYIGGMKEISPDEIEAVENGPGFAFSNQEVKEAEEAEAEKKGKLGVPTSFEFETVTIQQPPIPKIASDFKNIKDFSFRIYSHNVKNGNNHELGPGEQIWEERLVPLTASIRFNTMVKNSIITLQEVYKYQMLDIMAELNRHEPGKWEYYGRGRLDGDEIGEFVPILWQPKEWELIYSDTMWLNEKDPRSSLNGWDAIYVRIASFVTLKHKKTNNYINVFNSHFDHIGLEAQVGSAELILEKMKELNQWPSFFCGDLNIEPDLDPYKRLATELVSSKELATPFNRYGHFKSSVTGFEGEVLLEGGQNIDYIFAPKYARSFDREAECNSQLEWNHIDLKLYQYGMLHSKFNGRYISDHRPLVGDFIMTSKCV